MSADTHTSPAELASEIMELMGLIMRGTTASVFGLLEQLELSMPQMKVLHMLEGCEDEAEDLSVKDLAERMGMSLPGASRIADGMLRRGYVERREDPDDRRVKRLTITETGTDALRQIEAVRLEGLEQYTTTLSPVQRDALAGVLRTLPHKKDRSND